MVYGGRRLGVDNPDLLYAPFGSTVYVRTTAAGPVAATTTPFPGSSINGIDADPADWAMAYVVDSAAGVYRTTDAGVSVWENVTGNLEDPSLHSVVVTPDAVFVGGSRGVYIMFKDNVGVWYEFGQNLPNVPVWDMEYDATDDVLAVGTLGRGAWIVSNLSGVLDPTIYLPMVVK